MTGGPVRVRLRVRGLVQGVYFRAQMQEQAGLHGVAGWVRNLPDGSVEAVLEGDPPGVESVVSWARRGPPGARVDAVEAGAEEPAGEQGFRVRP